ncbi:ABC transporter permease [Natrarchaeobius chitinivorans]|uniref:FtsX-like permease family protein n=1 Tax=Natrarchaeobius chitinivorans TaxID=1679083 RepID=A0A3N6PC78_NATCH|nr:FtsX-like permease family protein [Natrarchaeobius chitinivorans]RQG97019.1 FtsX-like permease family protein [Natrarchaeobius chitinivorans]
MGSDGDANRRSRWRGLTGLSLVRVWNRATRTGPRRTVATVGAVALTIALLVIVTGVALALAGGVTSDTDADVRIAPEESSTLASIDGVEEPRFGDSSHRAAEIRSQEGVEHASPVLVELGRLETADGSDQHSVLLVGVVPDDERRTVAGLPTDGLEPGDPHYANGSYDGPPTGDIVLSSAAARQLEANEGDELEVPAAHLEGGSPHLSRTVTAVDDGPDSSVPIALVHLSELQTFTGSGDGELADEILVWGEEEAAHSAATDAYPHGSVDSAGGDDPSAVFDDGLAFATGLLALIVGVTICASFVATTAGMTVNEDRRTLAILESVGVPTRGRLAIVAVSTLATTVCGALIGAALGLVGIRLVNAVSGAAVAVDGVAASHPLLVPYAVAVALVAALIAVPYPLAVAARTSALEEVGQ